MARRPATAVARRRGDDDRARQHGPHGESTEMTDRMHVRPGAADDRRSSYRLPLSTGAAAVDLIRQFKVDYAIIGTSAIDEVSPSRSSMWTTVTNEGSSRARSAPPMAMSMRARGSTAISRAKAR